MTARYVFKVGPMNRNSDYATLVSVLGDTFEEARNKAVAFRGISPRDTTAWLVSVDEIEPDTEILERLAKLIRDGEKTDG